MKKTTLVVTVLVVAAGLLGPKLAIKFMQAPSQKSRYVIGILQTASHPALDAVREGFMQELTATVSNDVEFVIRNAQGSVSQAHSIAQKFHADQRLQAVFAIATPAAQAMSAVEKQKPIIIAAVTDPQGLGLLHDTTNVCGVKDMVDVKAEVAMLVALVPHTKSVGLLYTAGEANSLVAVQCMRHELEAQGLAVTDFAVNSESDIQAITELACRKVDLIFAPTDNMLAATVALTAAITCKYKKPFIVSDNMLVSEGPLAARGVDYKKSGIQAGKIAGTVLIDGIKPCDLPIEQAHTQEIFINKNTLRLLDLVIPEVLQNDVVLVG